MLTYPGSVQRESQTFQRNKNRTESCDVFENFQIRFILFCFSLITAATKLRQGNIFTSVCHSVHGGGGRSAPLHAGIYPTGPKQTFPPGPKTDPPGPKEIPPGPKADTPGARSMSGRYASYWNAFLLGMFSKTLSE